MTIFAVNSPMLGESKALNAEVSKRYYAVIVTMNYRGAIRIKRCACCSALDARACAPAPAGGQPPTLGSRPLRYDHTQKAC